jgi:hypothetical protein
MRPEDDAAEFSVGNFRRTSPDAAVVHAAIAFWTSTSRKSAKAKAIFRQTKRVVSRSWS